MCDTKSIKFGASKALSINDNKTKIYVLDILYRLIDLSKYGYKFLSRNDLDKIRKNKYYLTINTYGNKYFMLFIQNGKNNIYLIEKKSITFERNKVNLDKTKIILIDLKFDPDWYNNTLLDVDLVKDSSNCWFLSVMDIYYIKNKKYTHMNLLEKKEYLRELLIDSYFPNSIIDPARFIIDKTYLYNDLDNMIELMKDSKENVHGFKLFPEYSGISYIYRPDSLNLKKKPSSGMNFVFFMTKTDFSDVYNIFYKDEKNNNKKLDIALIDSIQSSHYMEDIFRHYRKLNGLHIICEYVPNHNKWRPIKLTNEPIITYDKISDYI